MSKTEITSASLDQNGAFTFNEDSADVDFRVESNGNANMLVVNGGGDRVGIGSDPDLGIGLHIKNGDTTQGTAQDDADSLVIENSAGGGMSLLNGHEDEATIAFGDKDDADIGYVKYHHNTNYMAFGVNASERMRLSSDGNVFVGKTSGGQDSAGIKMEGANGAILCTRDGAVAGIFTRLSDDGEVIRIMKDTSTVGTISVSGSSTAYNTSSDYRLKENEVAISDGITRLKTLKPYRFNFKSNPDTKVDGFLAHEVTAVPEAISGTKDKTETKEKLILDKDNNILEENKEEADWIKGKEKGYYPSDSTWVASKVYPVYQGIDQSKLVPLLTAALQEAITEIESLKARVTTLEE